MLRLLGVVISIGLADSLNPSSVGPALFLATGENARQSVMEFTAGTFAVFMIGGLILTLGPGHAILSLVPHPGATARYILETIAGAAMLVAAALVWRRRHRLGHRDGEESRGRRGVRTATTRNPAILGATIAVVELPTAFPYFAAIAAIVGSGLGVTSQVVLLAVYNVCFVLPLLGIVSLLFVFGKRAVEILARVRGYLQRRWPQLVSGVALSGAEVSIEQS